MKNPDRHVLFAALIAAVQGLGGNRNEQVVLGLYCQEENGQQPSIPFIAETLGVSVDQVCSAMAREYFDATGETMVPKGTVQ